MEVGSYIVLIIDLSPRLPTGTFFCLHDNFLNNIKLRILVFGVLCL